MNTLRRFDHRVAFRLVHPSDLIREDSAGVDHHLRTNLELLITRGGFPVHDPDTDAMITFLEKSDHPAPRGDGGTMIGRGHRQRGGHASVVERPIVIANPPMKTFGLDVGNLGDGLLGGLLVVQLFLAVIIGMGVGHGVFNVSVSTTTSSGGCHSDTDVGSHTKRSSTSVPTDVGVDVHDVGKLESLNSNPTLTMPGEY